MNIFSLGQDEQRASGFTHVAKIKFTDLVALGAVASGALTLLNGLRAGQLVRDAAFWLPVPFDGGATSALALDVGWNYVSGTDDPDGLLDNYEVHLDGTEVLAGDANGAAFATLRNGFAPQSACSLEATFTATGGNLNALTQGEVWIYLQLTDLKELANF